MLLPIIILLVAFLLIFLEFYLPGGVMGAAGGLLFVVSLVSFAIRNETWEAFLIFTTSAFVLLVVLIKFALWHIRRSKSEKGGIYHDGDQEGYTASNYEADVIGGEGEVLSDLKPSGHILVEGKRYQAVSQMGYIKKGASIKVVRGEGSRFIVKLK